MISKEEVQHIAKLARLGLNDEEIERTQKELSAILDYIEQLKEINTEGVEPTSHSVVIENVLREDIGKPERQEKKLLEMSPQKKDNYFKVKPIF